MKNIIRNVFLSLFIGVFAFSSLLVSIPASVAFAIESEEKKIDICHATPPDTAVNGYNLESVNTNALNGHDGDAMDIIPPFDDFIGQNWNTEGQAIYKNKCVVPTLVSDPDPVPATGTLKVCKAILDADGNSTIGEAGSTFTISFGDEDSYGGTPEGVESAVKPNDVTFNTPLNYNDIIDGYDVECKTISDLPLEDGNVSGRYYYEEESISDSGNWEEPLYQDQATKTPGAPVAFSFDNDFSDGVINLTQNTQHRTLLVVNKMKSVPTANLHATKIVCDSEEDLPNWGAGSADITGTTASTFLSEHTNCHQEDWDFEWIENANEPTPKDDEASHLADWNTFSEETTIPAGVKIWVREQANDDYIPFTGVNTTEDVSAEMYCNDDVLNYDNLEWINTEEDGEYYCVAWNVLKEEDNQCKPELDGSWADSVYKNNQGTQKGGSPVAPNRSNANDVLGEADWTTGGSTGFFSLGMGGSISVEFDSYVPDVAGNDISIHEATNGTYPLEKADIYVSQDGSDWELVGVADNTGSKVSYFDFSSTGFAWIKYVKVVDTTNAALFGNDGDGFDLDAIDVTQQVCDEPENTPDPEPEVCNPDINLLVNGGFEEPVVTDSKMWDTFVSGTPALAWIVEWVSGGIGSLELQRGVNSWIPNEGNQYAELDSDNATKIWQDVPTIPGKTYKLQFAYSPRPSVSDNGIEVYVDGVLKDTLSADGTSNGNTVWTLKDYTFTADEESKIEFKDISNSDSFGGFLDNVGLYCQNDPVKYDYVTTNPATSITTTSVVLNGTNGDVVAQNEAFWYGETNGGPFVPAFGDASSQYPSGWVGFFADIQDLSIGGSFSHSLNSLTPNTTYYFVAWSLVDGTWYPGEVLSFTTESISDPEVCLDEAANNYNGSLPCTYATHRWCVLQEDQSYVAQAIPNNEENPAGKAWETGMNASCVIVPVCLENQELQDNVCVDIETPEEPETPKRTTRSSGSRISYVAPSLAGQVLGAEASCGIYVDKFLKKGLKGNDKEAVSKIQMFLNNYMGTKLKVDGIFGNQTDIALKAFQSKHKDKILDPWGLKSPTGIFYLTTQTEVNNIMCPELNLPIPALTPMALNPLFPKA